jgi:hypothetical protein
MLRMKKHTKKLTLSRETLRRLATTDLAQIAGGLPTGRIPPTNTCGPTGCACGQHTLGGYTDCPSGITKCPQACPDKKK